MLTDMGPTAGQFYGSQIPTMGMNITNITNHIQKPNMNSVSKIDCFVYCFFSVSINFALQLMYGFKYHSPEVIG